MNIESIILNPGVVFGLIAAAFGVLFYFPDFLFGLVLEMGVDTPERATKISRSIAKVLFVIGIILIVTGLFLALI